MRFASFCALAGTAILAGHLVIAENSEDVQGLDVNLDGLAAEVVENLDSDIKLGAAEAISPEVLEGLTLTSEEEQELEAAEGQVFQAEVSRMMKLIINSIYKDKEIFLRELISNASDALDKVRLQALTDRSVLDTDLELRVRIRADTTNNVLHIEDTGIGMTKNEMIKNLGTIAKSGTAEFMEKIEQGNTAEASSLIGQFGVGFYSAFLVADKIVVTSKSMDDDQYVWTSDSSSFSIIKDPRGDTLTRGTRISLYMKREHRVFMRDSALNGLVKKYSEFIDFPIYSWKETQRAVEASDEDAENEDDEEAENEEEGGDEGEEGDDEGDDDDDEEEEEEKTELVWDYEHMNPQRPIWTRDPKEVSVEDYNNFYKKVAKDDIWDPLGYTHFKADGTEVGFKSILYIPSATIYEGMVQKSMQKEQGKNIKLYVRRVFITEELKDFVPRYLWFIKGIVDSDDLPLNVSRENLQTHKLLRVIRKKVVRKILDMIKSLAEDEPEKYLKFYKVHQSNIKLGVTEDRANTGRLANLLRYESSKSMDEPVSLDTYVENMKEGQKNIYFVSGASVEECDNSPFIEQLKKQDFEVLYMVDPIDEYALQSLSEYKEMRFMNVAKEHIKFDEETEDNEARKQHFQELNEAYSATKAYLRDTYSDVVDQVAVSTRLEESPCVLVASQNGWSGNMQRIMDARAANNRDPRLDMFVAKKKKLEINPRHPLIKKLKSLIDDGETTETTADLAQVLLDTALMRSGYQLPDQVLFSGRIERMLRLSMGVPVDEPVEALQAFEANLAEEDEGEDEVAADADEDIAAEAEEAEDHDEL